MVEQRSPKPQITVRFCGLLPYMGVSHAEIGAANHFGYEKQQEESRKRWEIIPDGECLYFDEAYERLTRLQKLDLSKLRVNMFTAFNNQLINDGCGLFRDRQILPFEHLSGFQNDLID